MKKDTENGRRLLLYIDTDASEGGDLNINWSRFIDIESFVNPGKTYVKTQLEGSEKTLTIDGQKYTAKYKYTRPGFIYSTFMYDFYSGDYGGFLIDDKSGKLCSFGHPHTDPAYAVEEAAGKASAERFLRDVADIDNFLYEGITEGIGENLLEYSYRRVLNGIKTSEAMFVSVNGDGEVVDYYGITPGAFEGYVLPSDFDPDEAHRKAEEKIEAVIDSQKDIHIVGHSTTRRDALLIMFDGRCFYCMDYAVDIDLEDRTSSAALVLFYAVD